MNSHCGIVLWESSNNTITNNAAFSNNRIGIQVWDCSNNTIENNNVNSNGWCGIEYDGSSNSSLKNNNISNSELGIELESSSNNSIVNNDISNNEGEGIHLWRSSNNKIYLNNFINNTDNVYSSDSTNFWNSTEKITYTYNDSACKNYLGNYWSDYKEKYPHAEEIDASGIWDTPHSIDSNNDSSPLVEPFENYFAHGGVIYVPNDYPKIQWAVDNASAGDTIIIRDGTYFENVDVDKQLTIRSENGSAYCVVDAEGNGSAIKLSADGITIEGFTVTNSDSGYYLQDAGINVNSNNNIITGNNISRNNCNGIVLGYSSNNNITGNNIKHNEDGIRLGLSSNNNIAGNSISHNTYDGIFLGYSSIHNNIIGNNISYNNDDGISLWWGPSNNNITGNNISHNRIDGIRLGYLSNNNITSNTISHNIDGIFLVYSINNTITDNNINSNRIDGICLWDSYNNNIAGNNINSNSYDGIHLSDSSNNTIISNTFVNDGLSVFSSYQNTVEDNIVNDKPLVYLENTSDIAVINAGQVILINCNNIMVGNLNLSNTTTGIELWGTKNSIISNNSISNNSYHGICFDYSSNNNIIGNTISYNHCGGIDLDDSSNNNITGNTISYNHWNGIGLVYSSSNNITGNNISNNSDEGICLWYSSNNNIITKNNISHNNEEGIRLENSRNNKIYLNNFINNTYNAYSYNSTNIWNSTEKITYTYKGSHYTNYLGNYWDDYKEKYPEAEEIDECGIWDTPYSIDSDADNYPLVKPWWNYFEPPENIFDTGSPQNPYPSIMGTHNGTITPNQTIDVSKLYTYLCSGTGGHAEYAKIWNNSGLDVNASWNGYVGDWHNISFSEPFTLMPNKTYNYTIRTGSYPQIHHKSELLTANGWINCTEFTDANGKIYYDWIPAIKLE